eukprot:5067701-Prymnesium_polylepis.1
MCGLWSNRAPAERHSKTKRLRGRIGTHDIWHDPRTERQSHRSLKVTVKQVKLRSPILRQLGGTVSNETSVRYWLHHDGPPASQPIFNSGKIPQSVSEPLLPFREMISSHMH